MNAKGLNPQEYQLDPAYNRWSEEPKKTRNTITLRALCLQLS
jgi:hypothetical protein